MKTHKTDVQCPFCGESAALTTEWGWVDDDTCTATLCCPSCRTLSDHSDDAVQVAHREMRGQSRAECELAAVAEVLAAGLPA